MKQIVEISTAIDKNADEKVTQLTIDWTDVSQEKVYELAARSVIITVQGKYRRTKMVPERDTIAVKELGTRAPFQLTPERMVAAVANFTPEQKRALMEQLKGMK